MTDKELERLALAAQDSQLKKKQASADEFQSMAHVWNSIIADYNSAASPGAILAIIARLRAAEADRDRLREALEQISLQEKSEELDLTLRRNADFVDGYDTCVDVARAALKEGT